MESVIQRIRARREKLAAVLRDEEYSGIRKIVEDLYPDKAHFLYELLQNAEDAGATQARFKLDSKSLVFIHDGRPFNERDIEGITNIGLGSKANEDDKIGRFGIGFKAVFAYCETPTIWSGPYCFCISDLVLPEEIDARNGPRLAPETQTIFLFPFNSTKKTREQAYQEIKAGLSELSTTTLLFLRHLHSIRWTVDGSPEESIARRTIDAQMGQAGMEAATVEIKRIGTRGRIAQRFLRVLEPAVGASRLSVGVAYELREPTEGSETTERHGSAIPRIAPAVGRVHVYFPAKKETSGLRFHVNAPFVPELSRASIKDIPANDTLILQIAGLAKKSLHVIKDKGLLTPEFLAVLPNPADEVGRYGPIREAIVEEMNDEPLTPTYEKSHAAATRLLQARASLKALLSEADLEFLVPYDEEPPLWAVGATQKNSDQDRFLEGLAITDWDIDQFVHVLRSKVGWGYSFAQRTNNAAGIAEGEELLTWLGSKSDEWHQQLYALLYRELNDEGQVARLHDLPLIRTSDGQHRISKDCFFPSEGMEHDEAMPRVARGVFTSGKSKQQQELARQFLVAVGVREVGEAEEIETLLRRRYVADSFLPDIRDLKRFIALVDKEPARTSLFANYHIFERVDGKWGQPSQVYLDAPFLDSDLGAYFDALGDDAPKRLSDKYLNCGIATEKLARFATLVGARTSLVVEHRSTAFHPASSELRKDYYGYKVRMTESSIDNDWWIPELDHILAQPTNELTRLVWRTMDGAPTGVLQAQFRPNRQYPTRQQDSSLVLLLKRSKWIPQLGGAFVVPAKARRDSLPSGFPFDAGKDWLEAIGFGEEETARGVIDQVTVSVAEKLGFGDPEQLHLAQEFAKLPMEEQRLILAEHREGAVVEEPDEPSTDPERRRTKVQEAAREAPDRGSELRLRAVSERRDGVKEGADAYLRQYYTKDKVMYCQIGNHALPFRLPNSQEYYFEAVEILTRKESSKHHKQNYLCLCPNHAAMFRFANSSRERMRPLLKSATRNAIELTLAGKLVALNFKQKHLDDLKAIMEEDRGPAAN